MKRTLLIAMLIVAACAAAPAQDAGATGSNRTSARADGALQIDAGTRFAAQLQQTLDVRRAKVGDEVALKTTEAIKSQGRTVVAKGARLVGHITEVKERTQGASSSSISLAFDRLESGSLAPPIAATIVSVTEARAGAQASSDDDLGAEARTSSSARGGTSSGGGLLNGVSGAAGSVVDTTAGAAGSAVGATTDGVNGVGRTVSGLRITQSTNADVAGSSTLSLLGGNLRLEKNTTFHLVVGASAGANDNRP